jgi:predicted metal-binding membrane protein
MGLLFVTGVMNIFWIAAITLLVGLEKLFPRGIWLSAATGVILTVWGSWLLAASLQ